MLKSGPTAPRFRPRDRVLGHQRIVEESATIRPECAGRESLLWALTS
jgi:hypothetical protein